MTPLPMVSRTFMCFLPSNFEQLIKMGDLEKVARLTVDAPQNEPCAFFPCDPRRLHQGGKPRGVDIANPRQIDGHASRLCEEGVGKRPPHLARVFDGYPASNRNV